jgi:hypothetical protein
MKKNRMIKVFGVLAAVVLFTIGLVTSAGPILKKWWMAVDVASANGKTVLRKSLN